MPNMQFTSSLKELELGIQSLVARTVSGNSLRTAQPTIAAAKTGNLTTRSSATAGTLTMDSGHGFTDGQRVDIYWDGGSLIGATIGTVSTNSVPFTGGTGTLKTSPPYAITAMVPTLVTLPVAAANTNLVGLLVSTDAPNAAACFRSDAPANVLITKVTPTNGYGWDNASGVTVPTGSVNLQDVYCSHSDSTQSRTVNALALVA